MKLKSIIKSIAIVMCTIAFAVLKLFLKRRIAWIRYKRVGHLGLNTEIFLRRLAVGEIKRDSIPIFLSCKPANTQLLTMIKRKIRVYQIPDMPEHLEIIVNKSLDAVGLLDDLPSLDNEYREINEIPLQISFTAEEEEQGKVLLQSMGIGPNDPFVCFHSRDAAYLNTMYQNKWDYHDFRDCSIEHYLPAAEYLTSLGIFAVRMGHIVEKPLICKSPKIIDYATDYRSDFGDIYLTAKCKYFLGNTAGICALPWIFGVPSAYANVPYIGVPPFFKEDVFLPKKLWDKNRKSHIGFKEAIQTGIALWGRSEQYQNAGIEVIENTSDEILELAKEVNRRIDGTWIETDEDRALQKRYRSLFPEGYVCFGFPSKIGAVYLRQNIGLLD